MPSHLGRNLDSVLNEVEKEYGIKEIDNEEIEVIAEENKQKFFSYVDRINAVIIKNNEQNNGSQLIGLNTVDLLQ